MTAEGKNTVLSFEAALESGCDGVELDVRMTRDGVLVVHHDETLPDQWGPLVVGEAYWPEISGTRYGEEGYRVERLEEVESLVAVGLPAPASSRAELHGLFFGLRFRRRGGTRPRPLK